MSYFIDVRESDEREELPLKVSNVLNIPLSEFEHRLQEIPKDEELIIVCYSGARSSLAVKILLKAGFTKVSNLEGGLMGSGKKLL